MLFLAKKENIFPIKAISRRKIEYVPEKCYFPAKNFVFSQPDRQQHFKRHFKLAETVWRPFLLWLIAE